MEFSKQGRQLSETQKGLYTRVEKVIGRIRELPEANVNFGYELKLLGQVAGVMDEAREILAKPETGNPAIPLAVVDDTMLFEMADVVRIEDLVFTADPFAESAA